MNQLAHATTESHIPSIERVLYNAKTDKTGGDGASFMTKLVCSATISFLCFWALVLPPNSWAQQRAPIVEQIAKTYGVDSWSQVEAIRYTWNVQFAGLNISHSWEWEPKTNKVSYEGKDKDGKPVRVSYNRSELGSQSDVVKKEVDPAFINDNYPLLFPLKAYWDTSAIVIDHGMYNLPVGSGTAELVAVKYPTESGGYTPGDTWELYIGKDNRIEYLAFERGGPVKPSLFFATWAGHKKAGPLLIATDHKGTADGKPIRIWYSVVSVKLTGSDKWIDAQ